MGIYEHDEILFPLFKNQLYYPTKYSHIIYAMLISKIIYRYFKCLWF